MSVSRYMKFCFHKGFFILINNPSMTSSHGTRPEDLIAKLHNFSLVHLNTSQLLTKNNTYARQRAVFLFFLILSGKCSKAHPFPYPSRQQAPERHQNPVTPVNHLHVVASDQGLDDAPRHLFRAHHHRVVGRVAK